MPCGHKIPSCAVLVPRWRHPLRRTDQSFRRIHQFKPLVCRGSLTMWTNNSCAACREFWSVRPKTIIRNRTGTWCDLAVTEYFRASGTAQRPLRHLGCTRSRPQRVLHTATLELIQSVQYCTAQTMRASFRKTPSRPRSRLNNLGTIWIFPRTDWRHRITAMLCGAV
jgi:hypothetical protein